MNDAAQALAPAAGMEHRFAVWTRSQCEGKVEAGLRRKQHEIFLPRVRVPSRLSKAEAALARQLCLPMHAMVSAEDVERSVGALDTVLRARM